MSNLGTYFLFLLAVVAGWALGRLSRSRAKRSKQAPDNLFEDYFVGLNYLLNDEPDEAVDTFIDSLEVDSNTIETHLALGALLRRRGKVDKAINVHQALLARPGLESDFSDAIRLQLSLNYIAGGLLDRAERLLNELLSEGGPCKWDALQHLLTIYQTEKEWGKAIETSEKLLKNPGKKESEEVRGAAAHYCCELAEQFFEQSLERSSANKARDHIKRAFSFDRHSIRAALLLAQVEQSEGKAKAAIKELSNIIKSRPEFIVLALPQLSQCYRGLNSESEYPKKLMKLLHNDTGVTIALAYSQQLQLREGDVEAVKFLHDFLARKPSLKAAFELLQMQMPRVDDDISRNLEILKSLLQDLIANTAAFRCNHCGFELKNLLWMCPSCKKWDKIKPIADNAVA